ncbi:SRPBCC family protein [Promicromonospora sp. NPDC019610]|uniref:SRPBCC family protein n=1 Tax=Promicromonospora sp. NPDC019610 TaxID=3364405 RepID=UPI00378A8958
MASITKSIDVEVPVRTAYNQWTQFEQFPRFMEGVQEIRQLDPTHTHWKTSVGGVEREFDAEITEQHPDERVAWASRTGPQQAGVVTFHRLQDDQTRVTVQLDWSPEGATEKVGSALNFDERQVQGDLARFKEFIESRGGETGAWRGDVS